MSAGIPCTISERGNGLPDVGDHVPADDGAIYRIVSLNGRIQTGQPGEGNWINARVVRADWDDVEEGSEFPALAVLDSGHDPDDEAACVEEMRAEHDADVRRMSGDE